MTGLRGSTTPYGHQHCAEYEWEVQSRVERIASRVYAVALTKPFFVPEAYPARSTPTLAQRRFDNMRYDLHAE